MLGSQTVVNIVNVRPGFCLASASLSGTDGCQAYPTKFPSGGILVHTDTNRCMPLSDTLKHIVFPGGCAVPLKFQVLGGGSGRRSMTSSISPNARASSGA